MRIVLYQAAVISTIAFVADAITLQRMTELTGSISPELIDPDDFSNQLSETTSLTQNECCLPSDESSSSDGADAAA